MSFFNSISRTIARSSSSLPARSFSSSTSLSNASKVPIALIAQLRKINPISLSKAREALSASENSVEKALEWLNKDLEISGAKKAEKVGSRSTREGLIGVTVMGTRAAMVEMRCETDFVSRNQVFKTLVQNVTSTTAFLDAPSEGTPSDPLISFPINDLAEAPVIPLDPTSMTSETAAAAPVAQTVSQAIRSAITQTGENIQLSRAVSYSSPLPPFMTSSSLLSNPEDMDPAFYLPGVYVHGSSGSTTEGTVGALSILSITSTNTEPILQRIGTEPTLGGELQKLARAISRQIVGFPTTGITAPSSVEPVGEGEISPYLLEQPFMMFQNEQRPVKEVLESWGGERQLSLKVSGMRRWAVGEEDVEA